MNYLRMELKVCEGCGALWLRNGNSEAGPARHRSNSPAGVYCNPCVRLFAAFPAARGPKKNSRIRIRKSRPAAALAGAQGGAR